MSDPKSDPRRRCQKLPDWPVADRAAWEAAVTSKGLLEEGGLAAGWRETTKKAALDAYGRYLTFLAFRGELDDDAKSAERLNEDCLRAYIEELQAQVAPITLRNRITYLHEALRVMVPDVEFPL